MMSTSELLAASTRRFIRRRPHDTGDLRVFRPSPDTWVDGQLAAAAAAADCRPTGRIGTIVAERYYVRGVIGSGSSGAVFEAVDQATGQIVALKVLHERHREDREQVGRFLREAELASRIGHPGVVDVQDAGIDPTGRVYMAMERLAGESLAAVIDRGELLPTDAVEIGRQLLDALAAAHARGIVHRDVKPENIFLTRDADGALRVKLLDFGIAKCAQGAFARGGSTMDGMTLGTPHYMSPEQCRGDEIGPQSDLWAVGAVLYHALTGEMPYDADNIGVLLERIVTRDAPSLAKTRPELPKGLVAVIDRALTRAPSRRWYTAREMASALVGAYASIEDLDW